MKYYQGGISMPYPSSRGNYFFINSLLSLSTSISDITDGDNFDSMLENKVQVSSIQSVNLNSSQGKAVDAIALSKQWIISPNRSNNKVRKTNQHGRRMVMNPQMPRSYPTNDRMLRYPHLPLGCIFRINSVYSVTLLFYPA